MDKVRAWHFLPDDGRLANRNRRKVEIGKTYSVRGPIVICHNGMHGASRVLDALYYAPGAIVERVEIWGDVVEQKDKLCGRYRKCLALADVTRLLHEFACDVAEDALKIAKVKDERGWAAIKMKRKWLDGKATDEELAAAWAAVGAAARAAAWAAAGAAARTAAWAAAWAAARAAARTAAWENYNTWLTERIEALLGGGQ